MTVMSSACWLTEQVADMGEFECRDRRDGDNGMNASTPATGICNTLAQSGLSHMQPMGHTCTITSTPATGLCNTLAQSGLSHMQPMGHTCTNTSTPATGLCNTLAQSGLSHMQPVGRMLPSKMTPTTLLEYQNSIAKFQSLMHLWHH